MQISILILYFNYFSWVFAFIGLRIKSNNATQMSKLFFFVLCIYLMLVYFY